MRLNRSELSIWRSYPDFALVMVVVARPWSVMRFYRLFKLQFVRNQFVNSLRGTPRLARKCRSRFAPHQDIRPSWALQCIAPGATSENQMLQAVSQRSFWRLSTGVELRH
jgi:hypothetical protein